MVLGIFYGMNAEGISMRLDIPKEAARNIHTSMMERYSGLAVWVKTIHKKADLEGIAVTLDGFTRTLVEEDVDKKRRQAVNTTVQGSMADILKRAVVAWPDNIGGLACLVHDSLVVDVEDHVAKASVDIALNALQFDIRGVKMELKAKTGKTWGSVTDDKPDTVITRI